MKDFFLATVLLLSVISASVGDATLHKKKLDIIDDIIGVVKVDEASGRRKLKKDKDKSKAPKTKAPDGLTKAPKTGKKTKTPKTGKKSKAPKGDSFTTFAPSIIEVPENCTLDEDCIDEDFFCKFDGTCCEYNTTCEVPDGAPLSAASTMSFVGLSTMIGGLIVAVLLRY